MESRGRPCHILHSSLFRLWYAFGRGFCRRCRKCRVFRGFRRDLPCGGQKRRPRNMELRLRLSDSHHSCRSGWYDICGRFCRKCLCICDLTAPYLGAKKNAGLWPRIFLCGRIKKTPVEKPAFLELSIPCVAGMLDLVSYSATTSAATVVSATVESATVVSTTSTAASSTTTLSASTGASASVDLQARKGNYCERHKNYYFFHLDNDLKIVYNI